MAAIGKMEYAGDPGAFDVPQITEYPIVSTTVIEKGEVVRLDLATGYIVAVGDVDQDDPYLGVAAESHSGAADTQNPRENGTTIKVYDSPTAYFRCKPNVVTTADSGTITNWVDGELVAGAGFADDSFTGGYIKIKGQAGGTLTVPIDTILRIKDFTVAAGTIIAETGALTGAVAAGDTALLFPPVLSFGWDLNSDGTNLDLKAKGGESIQIVRVDPVQEYVYWKFRLHQKAGHMLAI